MGWARTDGRTSASQHRAACSGRCGSHPVVAARRCMHSAGYTLCAHCAVICNALCCIAPRSLRMASSPSARPAALCLPASAATIFSIRKRIAARRSCTTHAETAHINNWLRRRAYMSMKSNSPSRANTHTHTQRRRRRALSRPRRSAFTGILHRPLVGAHASTADADADGQRSDAASVCQAATARGSAGWPAGSAAVCRPAIVPRAQQRTGAVVRALLCWCAIIVRSHSLDAFARGCVCVSAC